MPLSKWTFFVAETMMDSCIALDAAESIESPSRPNTPLLLDASRPAVVSPPTAPEERATVFSVPPEFKGNELDVFMTAAEVAPTVAPAFEATPPTRLALRPDLCTAAVAAAPGAILSSPEAARGCAEATA